MKLAFHHVHPNLREPRPYLLVTFIISDNPLMLTHFRQRLVDTRIVPNPKVKYLDRFMRPIYAVQGLIGKLCHLYHCTSSIPLPRIMDKWNLCSRVPAKSNACHLALAFKYFL